MTSGAGCLASPPCWLQVTASRDTLVKTWQVGQQVPLLVLQAHSLSITGLSALPEHGCICTGARDYAVKLWDVQTGQMLAEDTIQQNVVTYICRIAEEHSVLQVWPELIGAAWRPAGLCGANCWATALPAPHADHSCCRPELVCHSSSGFMPRLPPWRVPGHWGHSL